MRSRRIALLSAFLMAAVLIIGTTTSSIAAWRGDDAKDELSTIFKRFESGSPPSEIVFELETFLSSYPRSGLQTRRF